MNTNKLWPREKLLLYGVDKLTDEELLAIIIRKGTRSKNVFEVSNELLKYFNNFISIQQSKIDTLKSFEGIGEVSAINIKAAMEIGKRYHLQKLKSKNKKLTNCQEVYEHSQDMIYLEKETVRTIFLNSKLQIITHEDISVGTADSSIAHPRDIFKPAINYNAISIILVHNHPSGDPTPSKKDIDLTKKIKEAGKLIGVNLNDHIIVGNNSYYSFNLLRKVFVDE